MRYPSETLRKADIALEQVLQSGEFTVITESCPDGKRWTVEEYRQRYNRKQQEYPDADLIPDAAGMVHWLHDMHDMGLYFIDRNGVLRAEAIGQDVL
ncbi:hypothetical protein [Streptomyces sp. NRRL WC-3742]|uniref:hypothetical protein n=1 Tax=Streptomyces sp. NRRL WC-3742 TaxID=1463934 RepID=UPI000A69139F|nr:hypothetical protein [Streptomyces sp. NRRL WC-3742]